MLVKFQVVPSMNCAEPDQAYFKSLEVAALNAAAEVALTLDQAWAICEYLDAVDAGDFAMNRANYRQCVGALAEYLNDNRAEICSIELTKKSWAASTLFKVLEGCTDCSLMMNAA